MWICFFKGFDLCTSEVYLTAVITEDEVTVTKQLSVSLCFCEAMKTWRCSIVIMLDVLL